MTTCFHKYTPPEGQTQVIARAQSISLIRCLFRLVKCKFTEPLYKSAWYTLLSLLIFSTYALSIKREGHNLNKKKKIKKKRKYRGCCGCCIPLRLCSQKRGIAILRLSRQPYLSVNFEPLCIGPIMSISAVRGDQKGEIGQSPKKKKFKDSTISREDLDDAIASSIELAFKEQQSTLDSVVTSAVRDAVDSVLIPALRELRADIQATNNSVKELRAELEAIATAAKQTRDRVDSVQAAAREDRRTVTDLRNRLEPLTEKMTDMEDRSRRNNVWLVGLPEGAEGSNAAGFLRVNLSKWIPSLRDRNIEIDRAHHVYDGRKNSDRPRTLIFRVLRWHDRSEILKGARQAYPVKGTQYNVTLLFFPDFSPATTIRRKAFNPVLKKMTALGLQPFLTYPAAIKLRHKGG